jgi:ssDNA-binding Zn-finger/Zn-ribbon topoisomerase 1
MYGNCSKCGWAMRVVVINSDGAVFVECSNPDCNNKWGD